MLPDVARIVVDPAAPNGEPLEPVALLIVATPVLEEFQVADAVRFSALYRRSRFPSP